MKEFVFLYPIQPYLDVSIGKKGKRWTHQELLPARLNALIDQRYRQNGFSVNWVMFSQEHNSDFVDWNLKAREIDIQESDNILNAGIPFSTHINERVYPDSRFILDQMPKFSTLRVGGFHQWDCVDKLASTAYSLKEGVDVRVDEDTTELFYLLGSNPCYVPMVRDVKYLLIEESDPLHDIMKENRANKPWFAQVIP